MADPFWSLPGPAAFLDAVEGDVRDGRSVVVALPENHPAGIVDAIGERVRRSELYSWRRVDAADAVNGWSSPAAWLNARFVPRVGAAIPTSARTLAEASELGGSVFCVERVTDGIWRAWSAFLADFASATRSRPPQERAVFLVPVVGAAAAALPADDVALSVRRWRGWVDRLDTWLLASRAVARGPMPLEHKLTVALVVELAGSDPDLVRVLCARRLEGLLDPTHCLREFAEARGWSPELRRGEAWAAGALDTLDGADFLHSALAAGQNKVDLIARRIWKAEVAVLFPFLEESRLDIVRDLSGQLHVPFDTPFGTITDARDLELGQILFQVKRRGRPGVTLVRLECLTRIRHALAHGEPARSEDILSVVSTRNPVHAP